MSTSLLEQLSDSQREIDAEKSTIKSYLAERFSSDDQILNRLPGIVAQIVAEPKAAQDDKSIAQWCKAIISFRAAEIKARVDTVYLKSLRAENSKDATSESGDDLEDRKIALKTELETLHQEIASIAEMVVEHEIRQPMMDMRERREREKVQTRAAWLDYVRTRRTVRFPMLTCCARFCLHSTIWINVSKPSLAYRPTSINSSKHLHTSTTQLPNAY